MKAHFLYVLGKCGKSRMCAYIFERLCSDKDRAQTIAAFWEKYRKKLGPIPKDAIIISFLPEDVIAPVCQNHKVLALVPGMPAIDKKSQLFNLRLGEPRKIDTYYFGNSIDDSLIGMSNKVIVRNGTEYDHKKKSFKRMFFVREFLMYVMVGGINTLCGVISAYLFSLVLNPMLAFVVGYACFLVLSYYLNSKLTFKQSYSLVRFLKFCLAYLPSFAIQFLLAGTLINVFGDADFFVYVLTVVAGIPLTFVIMRFFAFAKKGKNDRSKVN